MGHLRPKRAANDCRIMTLSPSVRNGSTYVASAGRHERQPLPQSLQSLDRLILRAVSGPEVPTDFMAVVSLATSHGSQQNSRRRRFSSRNSCAKKR